MAENKMMRLHIENTTSLGPVFEASAERVAVALERVPGLAERISVTIGYDGENLEQHLPGADALCHRQSVVSSVAQTLFFVAV